MTRFRKYAVISTQTSRTSHDGSEVHRISWLDLKTLENLADYDAIVVDLTALGGTPATHIFAAAEIDRVFDPYSWARVLEAGGAIFVVGEPATECTVPATPLRSFSTGTGGFPIHRAVQQPANKRIVPIGRILAIAKDSRSFDFRRVIRDEESDYEKIYKYLDQVRTWQYSLRDAKVSVDFVPALIERSIAPAFISFARTTFGTFLAGIFEFSARNNFGYLTLLPGSGGEPGVDALWILREFLNVSTHVPPPQWTQKIIVPDQREIESSITAKKAILLNIKNEIAAWENDLTKARGWLRLLYDDGFSLEQIVRQSFETLGGSVNKASKEKDDYRLNVEGFPEGVLEVKGTHNRKFAIGSLRQLANWMDEAMESGAVVKGIFIGNAARTEPVLSRDAHLFEENNEKFARLRKMAIIRTADLYAVTVLHLLEQLEISAFWKELFGCQGRFDASAYWAVLPSEYQLN